MWCCVRCAKEFREFPGLVCWIKTGADTYTACADKHNKCISVSISGALYAEVHLLTLLQVDGKYRAFLVELDVPPMLFEGSLYRNQQEESHGQVHAQGRSGPDDPRIGDGPRRHYFRGLEGDFQGPQPGWLGLHACRDYARRDQGQFPSLMALAGSRDGDDRGRKKIASDRGSKRSLQLLALFAK